MVSQHIKQLTKEASIKKMENVFQLSHLQPEEILERPKVRNYFIDAIQKFKPELQESIF